MRWCDGSVDVAWSDIASWSAQRDIADRGEKSNALQGGSQK
jgi:mannose-1-phosphate guanylyltransferase